MVTENRCNNFNNFTLSFIAKHNVPTYVYLELFHYLLHTDNVFWQVWQNYAKNMQIFRISIFSWDNQNASGKWERGEYYTTCIPNFFLVTCGETFVAFDEVQSFSTPNWPNYYPDNQDCYWLIRSDEGRWFDVTLNEGQTESEFDFIEVRNVYCS